MRLYLQSKVNPRCLVQGGYHEAERSATQGFYVVIEILEVGHIALVVLELKPRDRSSLQFLAHHLNKLYFFHWLANHASRPVGVLSSRRRGARRLSGDILRAFVPNSRRQDVVGTPTALGSGRREISPGFLVNCCKLLIQKRIHLYLLYKLPVTNFI